jgi:hypothetical protein
MKVIDLLKSKLPHDYVQAVIRNLDSPTDLFQEAEDIEVELMSLFDWSNSKEGYEFWADVFSFVCDGTPLPKLKKIDIEFLPGATFFTKNQIMMFNIAGMDINLKFDYDPIFLTLMSEEVEEKYYTWMN